MFKNKFRIYFLTLVKHLLLKGKNADDRFNAVQYQALIFGVFEFFAKIAS